MADPQEEPAPSTAPSELMAAGMVRLLGTYLVLSFLVQIALLIEFWPVAAADGIWKKAHSICLPICLSICPPASSACEISDDGRLIVLVLLSGGAGAMVHAIRSFTGHLAFGQLYRGWGWWYFLRPVEGAMLALAFYLAIRGGFLGASNVGDGTAKGAPISVYGIAGMSVLVGMFSQQAVAKLKEVAETFFRKPEAVPPATASQARPKPTLSAVAPTAVRAGDLSATLTLTGTGFVADTEARVGGVARPSAVKSATELAVTLSADDLKTAGTKLKLTVFTPAPGGGESDPVEVAVN